MRYALLGLAIIMTAPAHAESQITNLPASQLDWETTPEGVAFAALDGNRFETSYMAMVRLPAGLVSPPHVKTANMYGIVVEGMMTHAPHHSTETATVLGTGSFYKVPKDLAHVSSCVSEVPCVTFLYQDGQFDFLPVTQP